MTDALEKLKAIRTQLDQIDSDLLHLMNKRAELALQIGHIKQEMHSHDYYRPEREAQILQTIMAGNQGPLDNKIIVPIFRALISACLALQKKVKVAFLGPVASFTHAAALKHFGAAAELVSANSINQVFRDVEEGLAQFGVVAIENSSAGVVQNTLNNLINANLSICGETILPIQQYLLRQKKASGEIQRIYAHEMSFLQCEKWLATHFPQVEKITVASNAKAAHLAALDETAAALAAEMAAAQYDLDIVAANVADNANNQTRFLIIGKQKVAPSGMDKTTLLIATPHTPGTLLQLLTPLAESGINISWVESRPYQHRNWSYLFVLDIEGHIDDEKVKLALQKITDKPVMVNVLGSYPKAWGQA